MRSERVSGVQTPPSRPRIPQFSAFSDGAQARSAAQLDPLHTEFRVPRSGWQEEQAAAGGDPQSADGLESSLGSAQDYEEQQAEVAAELSNYGIVRAPSVTFAVPIGPYYVPRTFSSAAPVFRVVPRPSIVPHGVPGPVGGFPRGFFGGFRGGGFSHMSGFHGRFGHR